MNPPLPAQPERRAFFAKLGASLAGALALGIPVVGGLALLFDPLRRKSAAGVAVRVTSLSALPENGEPRKFSILATRIDAWNRTPNVPVGAVYLRRTGTAVAALNVACPHAGCFVEHAGGMGNFICPCHNSAFDIDGKIADPSSPSPRPLDSLPVEVREGGEIWVRFQNFRAGVKEQIPV